MVYNCDICGKAFGYLFSMKKHREKHAPFCNTGTFQPSFAGEEHHLCVLCNRLFSCYASLKRHQLTTHTENGPVFHCPYCPYSNSFSWQVKRHIYKRHGLEESYFCGGCKTFFRAETDRDRHVCQAPSSRYKQHTNHDVLPSEPNTATGAFYEATRDKDSVDEEGDSQLSHDNPSASHGTHGDSADDDAANLKQKDSTNLPGGKRDPAASSSGTATDSGDTPCICSECGTCLPCFEDMVKHQMLYHPAKLQAMNMSTSGNTSADFNSTLVAAAALTARHLVRSAIDSRRRASATLSTKDSRPRSRSPLNPGSSAGSSNRLAEVDCSSGSQQQYLEEKHNISRLPATPSLLIPATSSNLLLTTVGNEAGASFSPGSAIDSSSSSPSVLLPPGQSGWECNFCGISFSDPALWGLHSTMHDVNDLRKCNFCGRQARDKYDFWRHFIDHNKVPTVQLATPPISSSSSGTTQEASTPTSEPISVPAK